MNVTSDQLAALELVNQLSALQGPATALDKLVGRMILEEPNAVVASACAELLRMEVTL